MSWTPCLPNEIWLHIFDHATPSIYAFITGDLPPTAPRSCVSPEDQWSIWAEFTRNLQNVVRVCKLWNKLATPHLYRIIHLNQQHLYYLLERTLSSSQQESADKPGIRPLGWWTRRLELDAMVVARPGDVTCLANILRYTPNLTVFLIPNYHVYSSIRDVNPLNEVSKALKEVCAQSLQVFILDGVASRVNGVLMSFLSAAAPNLRVLSCWCIRGASNLSFPYAPRIKSLTVPTYDCSLYTDETNHFPSLQNLTIVVNNTSPNLSGFLRIYGMTLTTVEIIYGRSRSDDELISIIARSCPRLIRLDLHASLLTLVYYLLPHLPSVTILGLRLLCPPFNDLGRLRTALQRHTFPSLKIIQFLALDQFLDAMRLYEMPSIVMDLSKKGIHVQDANGVDISHQLFVE